MKIKYATVKVTIGTPYSKTLSKTFRVSEGESYVRKGFSLGHVLLMEFVETQINKPTNKDYRYFENISTIKVDRFRV